METEKYFKKFNFNPGIKEEELNSVPLPELIPSSYIDFLKLFNGGEGFIGEEYLILYKAEEIQQMNIEYEVSKNVPGIIIFGSNGGGEALAFDIRKENVEYILIPFLFEYEAIIYLGNTLDEFFERVFTKGFFI